MESTRSTLVVLLIIVMATIRPLLGLIRQRPLAGGRAFGTVNIVLVDDFENLGVKGSEVTVKAGYMRNFLYPKGVAKYATPENLEKYKTVFVVSTQAQATACERRESPGWFRLSLFSPTPASC